MSGLPDKALAKSGIQDSNLQPHGPKPCTLANCANPRKKINPKNYFF